MTQADLFAVEQQLPNGLLYRPDFLTADEERALLAHIEQLPFRAARFQQYTARRRVVRFGEGDYLESEPDQETDFPRIEFPHPRTFSDRRISHARIGREVEKTKHFLPGHHAKNFLFASMVENVQSNQA